MTGKGTEQSVTGPRGGTEQGSTALHGAATSKEDGCKSAPLNGMHLCLLAVNVPGPAAAARLRRLGALVTKVEPPEGDPLEKGAVAWYRVLNTEFEVLRLNLKEPAGRNRFEACLARSDLLLTSLRPQALGRLGLTWEELHGRYPRLCQVAIIGYRGDRREVPGHDLTYLAEAGLVIPPSLPRTLLADLVGAERAVSAALSLLLWRERQEARGGEAAGRYTEVSLADAAHWLAEPFRLGVTAPGGVLGGGMPAYNLYQARDGWVALAALEPRFWQGLAGELGITRGTGEELTTIFQTRSAREWQEWARERGLPLTAVEGSGAAGERDVGTTDGPSVLGPTGASEPKV